MSLKTTIAILLSAASIAAHPQAARQKPAEEPAIRISTELVQLDVVVTDKKGRVVPGLNKGDFELYENGKKMQISFFEYVEAAKGPHPSGQAGQPEQQPEYSPQGLGVGDVRRIFAFVVDDLTIRFEDMVYLREMLTNFVDHQMQPNDLVAIVRTVGGKGLLQQFTTDKALLRRAIEAISPSTHPLAATDDPAAGKPEPLEEGGRDVGALDVTGHSIDVTSPLEATNKAVRTSMSLSTLRLTIKSMKQLPGRKSLVLISGGFPILPDQGSEALFPGGQATGSPNVEAGRIAYSLNVLADDATRAGVVIHTVGLRGMEAYRDVATFDETPGRSAVVGRGTAVRGSRGGDFARTADESMLGRNPADAHLGLKWLSSATGGVSVLKKNNLEEGLAQILSASDGYYLVAYTPPDSRFDNRFRKIEIKVKRDGLKVYSRSGYYAREDKAAAPPTRQEELLAAVRSPLARRDLDVDAMLLYKATRTRDGAIDIHLVINPRKLNFEPVNEKRLTDVDVAGFVFDQLGKLRNGFSETLRASLTPDAFEKVSASGLSYSARILLPPGAYQVRLAVRDNKTNSIGTLSRYVEVPDLSKNLLAASSLLLGPVPAGDTNAANSTPITANRQISQKQDLRYAVIIYNAKLKDSKPQVRTQLTISQNGQTLFKEADEAVPAASLKGGQLLKWGQIALAGVKPGRYTMTLTVTDPLADKKAQTLTRTTDFVVVN